MKTYKFTDDSYFESPGCSCCESYCVSVFNSEDTSPNLGSAHSEEECYIQAIATESGWEFWEDVPDDLHELMYGELKKVASGMGIEVDVGMMENQRQPDTPLHDPNYPIHWQTWVKGQIEGRFLRKPRKYVMKALMSETRGCINPKWISQFCCPACGGTGEFDIDGEKFESCLNCAGRGWLVELEVE